MVARKVAFHFAGHLRRLRPERVIPQLRARAEDAAAKERHAVGLGGSACRFKARFHHEERSVRGIVPCAGIEAAHGRHGKEARGDHARARIAVYAAEYAEGAERHTGDAGFLLKLAGSSVRKFLLHLNKAARQRPGAEIRVVAAANEQHGEVAFPFRLQHGKHRHVHRNGRVAVLVRIVIGKELFQREAVFVSQLLHSYPPLRQRL